ncbi:unnamed protein product, partial [Laminaria digitata]
SLISIIHHWQALLTDMYQVTMSYAYWRAGRHDEH